MMKTETLVTGALLLFLGSLLGSRWGREAAFGQGVLQATRYLGA